MRFEIISASAGSGKTYCLAERTFDAITRDGVRPQAIMAITYTNKAAAELAHRLRKRLIAAGHAEAAALLRDGYLGTVHSVAQRIITELAFESGRTPYPSVAAESHAARLFRIASNLARTEVEDDKLRAAIAHLELEGSDSRSAPSWGSAVSWRDLLNKLVKVQRSNLLSREALDGAAALSVAEYRGLLDPPTGDAAKRDAALHASLQPYYGALREQYESSIAAGKVSEALRKRWVALDGVMRTYEREDSPNWSRLMLDLKPRRDQLAASDFIEEFERHLSHPRLHAELSHVIEVLLSATKDTEALYTALKGAERIIDFEDMLAEAAQLLSSTQGRQSFGDRLDLLLVDEFQDTSPIQLQLLTALRQLAAKTVWVGDRKQSIYAFQGADPILMDAVLRSASAQEGVITHLESSYRSRPKLVDFCSELFAAALAPHGFARDEVIIHSKCAVPSAVAEHPALHLWPLASEVKKKEKRISSVAAAVARALRKTRLPVRERTVDPTTEPPARALRPSDIAVLARTNQSCRELAAGLRALGIEASAGNDSLGRSPEAWIIRAALALIADPEDALAAAEISAFTQEIDDPDAWLQSRIDEVSTRRSVESTADGMPKKRPKPFAQAPAVQAIAILAIEAREMTPEETVVAIIGALDLPRLVSRWEQPERHRGNLEALLGVARDYQEVCETRRRACTIAGLVRHLEELDNTSEQSPGATRDAVQVLTYHRSKGLEWPMVVCTDLEDSRASTFFDVHMSQEGEFDESAPLASRSLRVFPWPYGAKKKAPLLERLQQSARGHEICERDAAEKVRLLYVGMTRARDHLALVRGATAPKWLDHLLDDGGHILLDALPWETPGRGSIEIAGTQHEVQVEDPIAAAEDAPGDDDAAVGEQRHWFPLPAAVKPLPPQAVRPSEAELSETATAAFEVVERRSIGSGLQVSLAADRMSRFGDAVHAFLAVDVSGQLPKTQRSEVARALLDAQGLAGEIDPVTVLALADDFRAWLDAREGSGARLPEWPVQHHRPDGHFVSGDIDLLVESPLGWIIIDHKTTRTGEEGLGSKLRAYAGQLQAYKNALEAAGEHKVSELWIHLPLQGEMVRVAFG